MIEKWLNGTEEKKKEAEEKYVLKEGQREDVRAVSSR